MKHKWHKEIIAWANGAEIECQHKTFVGQDWEEVKEPMWLDDVNYRIKPQPKEPQYLYVYSTDNGIEFGTGTQIVKVKNRTYTFKCLGKIKLESEE